MTTIRKRNSERGMVLLVVLLVVALLVTLLVEFSFSTLVDLRLAEIHRDTTRAFYLAKGGIRVGRIILQEDMNGYDGLDETWAQGIANYPVADGTVSIRVTDLAGKIDLNRVVTSQGNPDTVFLDRYLLLLELLGAEDPDALADALIDWLDPDDEVEPAGAENFHYSSLPKPYNCKNGPLDSLDELLLVKGYGRELLRNLRPHVTVYGAEKININTASVEVLLSLSEEMTRSNAEMIVEARSGKPFTSIVELKELPDMETLYGFIYLYIDVKSSNYWIESTAFVNDGRRTVHAAYDDGIDQILYKRVL